MSILKVAITKVPYFFLFFFYVQTSVPKSYKTCKSTFSCIGNFEKHQSVSYSFSCMFSLKVLLLRQGQGTGVPRMIVETVNQSLIQTLKLKSSEPAEI